MKTRNILYGYKYENGAIERDQTETQRFLEMTGMYLDGMSLNDIAKAYNEQQVEYAPGVTGWNKSRIMRLLSDERYTGAGSYPAIISEDTHRHLLDRRDNNSYLINTDFNSEIYRLTVPIICPDCGNSLKRKSNRGKKGTKCFKCDSCGCNAYISDEDLICGIKKLLTGFVDDPTLINIEETSDMEEDKEITDLNWEIERSLERLDIKIDVASDNIRKLATLRHRAISEQYYISQKIRWDFIKSGRLREESPDIWKDSLTDLANRTLDGIHIGKGGRISIVLRNGQLSPEGA